jgi:hypothetical protein
MDFSLRGRPAKRGAPARSVFVLACASESHFWTRLRDSGAHVLLTTTGFMAPEAYTVEAIVRSWLSEADAAAVRDAAARAYDAHQGCGLTAARNLFKVRD